MAFLCSNNTNSLLSLPILLCSSSLSGLCLLWSDHSVFSVCLLLSYIIIESKTFVLLTVMYCPIPFLFLWFWICILLPDSTTSVLALLSFLSCLLKNLIHPPLPVCLNRPFASRSVVREYGKIVEIRQISQSMMKRKTAVMNRCLENAGNHNSNWTKCQKCVCPWKTRQRAENWRKVARD